MKRYHKKTLVVFVLVMVLFSAGVYAEGNDTVKRYMDEGIRAAYHNMHPTYQAYYDSDGEFEIQPGGYVAYEQEWDQDMNLISRTYLGSDGMPVNITAGYAKLVWESNADGSRDFVYYDVDGNVVPIEKQNLAHGISF